MENLFSNFYFKVPLLLFSGYYLFVILDTAHKKDGRLWQAAQFHPIWKWVAKLIDGKVRSEVELDHNQQYIFGCFPHGTSTLSHILTMTDGCGMLSKIHKGPRRDLAASVLFYIPLLRELCLSLGCVDASVRTAHYNLGKGRSTLIFVGGEKEQLLTQPRQHKIVLKHRKGFIKLALEHGAHLVPTYAFGENEAYHISNFALGLRSWLQRNFQIAITLHWGRWGTWVPVKGTRIHVEMGKPIAVEKKAREEIKQEDIDVLHEKFCLEMVRLFDRCKEEFGYGRDAQLKIE